MRSKITVFLSLLYCLFFTGCNLGLTTPTTTTSTTITPSTTTTSTTTTTTITAFKPVSDLGGGLSYTLVNFNGSKVYSLVTATPPDKPESDYAPDDIDHPSTLYEYTISTTAPLVPGRIASQKIATKTEPRTKETISGQAAMDLIARADGKRLLELEIDRTSPAMKRSKALTDPVTIGTPWNGIWVIGNSGQVTINAECRLVTDHAYFFVDLRDKTAIESYLAAYGTAFEDIYVMNRTKFANESDYDENGKVIVLFTQGLKTNVLGYFYAVDKFPNGRFTSASNEADMFYITADLAEQGPGGEVMATLAHEFQHMIYFDTMERLGVGSTWTWLDEALSQAAEYYNGYVGGSHAGWIRHFLVSYGPDYNPDLPTARYDLSLTHWSAQNYGYGAVFMRYLIDQFGDAAINTFYTSAKIGIEAVETATGMDFNDLFVDFTRALVMSGTGDSTNPDYAFTSLDLSAIQTEGRTGLLPYDDAGDEVVDFEAGDDFSYSVYPYGIEFDVWGGPFGTLTLTGTDVVGTAFGLSR